MDSGTGRPSFACPTAASRRGKRTSAHFARSQAAYRAARELALCFRSEVGGSFCGDGFARHRPLEAK